MSDPTESESYTQEQVEAIVSEMNAKARSFVSNALDSSFRDRITQSISGGYDYADTLHNVYMDYGYPAQVTFAMMWNMYRRLGIARNCIDIYPRIGWMDKPVIEGPTSFLSDIEEMEKRFNLWQRIKGADTRQRVGNYAGLFMRVRDGERPEEPIGSLNGLNSLVEILPLYQSQLRVLETDDDVLSDTFGQPSMYLFTPQIEGNRDPNAANSFNIHPSRLVIFSEDADDGSIYGVPVLESVYNSLMDVRKIAGGGAQGLYKNVAQSVVFTLKDGASAAQNSTLLSKFNEQFDEFQADPMRRGLWTPGLEPSVLQGSLPSNPKDWFMNSLNDIASGVNTPATILIGQQTGRLASSEDARSLLANVQSRRESFQTFVIRQTFDWLSQNNVIADVDYEVKWPDALALSEADKVKVAYDMALVNEAQFRSGQPTVYSAEEMRERSGFDPDDQPVDDRGENPEDDDAESEDEGFGA